MTNDEIEQQKRVTAEAVGARNMAQKQGRNVMVFGAFSGGVVGIVSLALGFSDLIAALFGGAVVVAAFVYGSRMDDEASEKANQEITKLSDMERSMR